MSAVESPGRSPISDRGTAAGETDTDTWYVVAWVPSDRRLKPRVENRLVTLDQLAAEIKEGKHG